MQPPPIPTSTPTYDRPSYATLFATLSAVGALLVMPIALIPFLGLAASALILGFITAIAIWTRRKRALLGTGLASLGMIIAAVSSFWCLQALLASRDAATAKVAQVQSQLETMKTQAGSNVEKSLLGNLIKQVGGNDITDDQANTLGKLGEWAIRAATSDGNDNSDATKK